MYEPYKNSRTVFVPIKIWRPHIYFYLLMFGRKKIKF